MENKINDSCLSTAPVTLLVYTISTLLTYQSPEDIASPTTLEDGQSFDFIIVGGGSAGCVLANRLSENAEWSVLLLEAGGEEPEVADVPCFYLNTYGTRLDWDYSTEPQPQYNSGNRQSWPRGKVLGGSSTINALLYSRGNRRDYDHWAEMGNFGWSYDEVLPYFKKSENNLDPDIAKDKVYHSTGGYLDVGRLPFQNEYVRTVLDAFEELGFPNVDVNAEHQSGVTLAQGTQKHGVRKSTNKAFLEPVRQSRLNLKVVTNARVIKILMDTENKAALGVEFVWEQSKTISYRIFAKKEVICSAGVINSPQLLMLSGVGPKEELASVGIDVILDLPGVGQNLQDHTGTGSVVYITAPGKSILPNYRTIALDKILYRPLPQDSHWAGTTMSQVVAYASSNSLDVSEDYPNIQFNPSPGTSNSCLLNVTSPVCYFDNITITPYIIRPKSRGNITLASSNYLEDPRITSNALDEEEDVDDLLQGCKVAQRLAKTTAFKSMRLALDETPIPGCEEYPFGTDDYFRCSIRKKTVTLHHPVGTCKMGPSSDPTAVVDPQLRVHGIKSLRVVDSSVIPRIVSGNMNAPTIMIAEKGADIIKKTWSSK